MEAAFPLSGVAPQGGEVVGVINLVTAAFSASVMALLRVILGDLGKCL